MRGVRRGERAVTRQASAHSRCGCGRGEPSPGADVGGGESSPGADVGGASRYWRKASASMAKARSSMLLLQRRSVRSPHDAQVIAWDATTPLSHVPVRMWQQAPIPVQMSQRCSTVTEWDASAASPQLADRRADLKDIELERELPSVHERHAHLSEAPRALRDRGSRGERRLPLLSSPSPSLLASSPVRSRPRPLPWERRKERASETGKRGRVGGKKPVARAADSALPARLVLQLWIGSSVTPLFSRTLACSPVLPVLSLLTLGPTSSQTCAQRFRRTFRRRDCAAFRTSWQGTRRSVLAHGGAAGRKQQGSAGVSDQVGMSAPVGRVWIVCVGVCACACVSLCVCCVGVWGGVDGGGCSPRRR